jgi:hypothetical protein
MFSRSRHVSVLPSSSFFNFIIISPIRNKCGTGPRSRITAVQTRNTAATARRPRAQTLPPGTEFLDAETGRQKSPLKRANAHRDQNSRSEWPEIPAEMPYLASYRKRSVCEDWMVETEGTELPTPHAVIIEPVSDIRATMQNVTELLSLVSPSLDRKIVEDQPLTQLTILL